MQTVCPGCDFAECTDFYSVASVPTNSCLLIADRAKALAFPTGGIKLMFCPQCGFVFNALWQAERTTYSEEYEETQGFSPTFNAFHQQLADDLIDRHRLHDKDIVEIGCGKGEFLSLLCERGGNRGVGYDPSFVPDRLKGSQQIEVVREFFGPGTVGTAADFVCCKMTLEHVSDTGRFVRAVRNLALPERGTIVFFQIPDIRRIFEETAFWDVYYEHCSYFAPSSLARLFRQAGFEVLNTWTGYDGQYLMIEARAAGKPSDLLSTPDDQDEIRTLGEQASRFATAAACAVQDWRSQIGGAAARGRRIVLWGSGSKAVAFLTTIGLGPEIEYVVDINPFRHDRFMPVTGQRIVGPDFLAEYRPDVVIAMNPIYRHEIAADMARRGVTAELIDVTQPQAEVFTTAEPMAAG